MLAFTQVIFDFKYRSTAIKKK